MNRTGEYRIGTAYIVKKYDSSKIENLIFIDQP